MREVGVDVVEADQCMYGLHTWGKTKSQLVLAKNPTKFMTNSRSLGRELSRMCDGEHTHQPLVDGRAKDAARYPPALCKAICRGVAKEKMQRQLGIRAVMEVGTRVHRRSIDTEEHHESPEEEMMRLIRKELGDKVLTSEDRILDGTPNPGLSLIHI